MAEPNFQSKFLYTVESSMSDDDRQKQLIKDFGPRVGVDSDWVKRNEPFKDPSKAHFEEQYIRPFPLAKYEFKETARAMLVHVMLHDVLDQAFTELSAFSKEHQYEIRSVGGFYLRYAKCPSTEDKIRDDAVYKRDATAWHNSNPINPSWNPKGNWEDCFNIWALHSDIAKGQLNWKLVSNHAWGIAIDINPEQNPLHGLKFDMPPGVVKLMAKHGFGWGGFYKKDGIDTMHFEYTLPTLPDVRRVYFPFSTSRPEPPTRYYQLNEAYTGGYYPVGVHQTLHGGAHVHPEPLALTPVVSPIPGYVVAARLMAPGTAGDNAVLQHFADGRPLSFVLLRHELIPVVGGTEKPDKAFALYSIYMHLDMPSVQVEGATLKEVPWLQRLLDLRFGGVVQLDPTDPNAFGTNHWASKKIDDGMSSFPVRDGPELPAEKDGRQVALAKPPPEDVVQAIDAFTKGAVVTFSQPLLQVNAGETIGLARDYVHWEFFAPSGAEGGIAKLLEQAGDWKSLFKRVKELSEDNFLELPDTTNGSGKNEIKPILVDTLPDDERQLVDGLMESRRYETALTNLFRNARSFAKAGDDKAQTRELFSYPIKLSLKNQYAYKGPKPSGKSKIEVSFTRNSKQGATEVPIAVGKKGAIEVTDFNQLEFVIQVPALADTIHLSSGDFFLDRIPLTPAEHIGSRLELLKTLAPFRWRHVLLEHVNEWTPPGLALLLDELEKFEILQHFFPEVVVEQDRLLAAGKLSKKEAPRDAIRTMLKPLTWWGRKATDEDPYGEVAIYGPKDAEESLFGTQPNQLPPDAKIDNLHPVTAAWMLDLLADARKIAFREQWPAPALTRSESTTEPPYCSFAFASETPKVGEPGFAVLVQHGYGYGENLEFRLEPSGSGSPVSLSCASKAGVFVQPLVYSFWGTWQLKAFNDKKTELKPRATPTVQLVTQKPVPAAHGLTVAKTQIHKEKKKVPGYQATIKIAEHLPKALAGYVYFRIWSCKTGTPDYSTPPEIGKVALPVVAVRVDANPKVKNVTIVDGFVTNAKPKHTPITKSFTWDALCQPSVFRGDLSKFRIDYELCKRLQHLRDVSLTAIEVTAIDEDGLGLALRPYSGKKVDYQKLVSTLGGPKWPKGDGFEETPDDSIQLITMRYTRPEQETGELTFEFESKAALAAVVGASSAPAGHRVFLKPSFIAPNCGHYVPGMEAPGAGAGDAKFDRESLVSACGGDLIELHSDLTTEPLHKIGLGTFTARMTAGSLATDLQLLGDIAQWKKAKPLIALAGEGEPVLDGQIINGNVLSANWHLSGRNSRWGKELSFSVKVSHPENLESAPGPRNFKFTALPKLESLAIKVSPGKLCLTGTGHAIPTDTDLIIFCEMQDASGNWIRDEHTTKAIKYTRQGSRGCGRCTEDGQFVANVASQGLNDARRFTWKYSGEGGKIGGFDPGTASVEYRDEPNSPHSTSQENDGRAG